MPTQRPTAKTGLERGVFKLDGGANGAAVKVIYATLDRAYRFFNTSSQNNANVTARFALPGNTAWSDSEVIAPGTSIDIKNQAGTPIELSVIAGVVASGWYDVVD